MILVLHISIIVSGFVLGILNEPLVDLQLLVAFNTGMDINHWNKGEQQVSRFA